MDDAYVAQMLLRDIPSVELWMHGKPVPLKAAPLGGMFLFNFQSSPVVRFHSPFDFVRFYIAQDAINELAAENGGRPAEGLSRPAFGESDPVLFHLASAVLPALDEPDQANQLFIDYIALGFHAHMTGTYSGRCRDLSQFSRGLAPWQARRVNELIDANLASRIGIAHLAAECKLSSGHFSRAFLQTFGVPPHRWLLHRRVERSKQLISSTDLPLADIGLVCGFASQSHFSRVFSMMVGTTPTNWRRMFGHVSSFDEHPHQLS
jgi:AraC-like DNA-binding protein